MKKIIAILMAMIMVMSVTVVLASGVADKDTKVPVIIGFKDKPSQADKWMIRAQGGDIKHSYTIIDAIAAKLPEKAIDNIKKNPKVAYVEPDGKMYAHDAELDNSWGVKHIGAGTVHDGGNTGAGVNVSIIDSGIDYDHTDLVGNYKSGIGYREGIEIDPKDDQGHGTHCAGIVAAMGNDAGVIGVAPEANLYAVKALNQYADGYYGWNSDIIKGIEWSVINSMQVISMSLSGPNNDTALYEACNAANEAGIVIVAAAGNYGNPPARGDNVGYPARYDSVIAVASTDSNDIRAKWSSTGPDVELSAPGVSIYSTYPDEKYAYMSGTSMACPHVAGTAALVIASDSSLTNNDVRQRLRVTADDMGVVGRDSLYGYGLVDADEAASEPDTTPPAITNVKSTELTSNSATIIWDTDEFADSQVKYGTEQGVYTLEVYNPADVTTHSVALTGLQPNTAYYYVVNSTDPSGNSNQSAESTFTTTEASSNYMHVDNISMSTNSRTRGRNTFVWAVATVTLFNASGNPVEGAAVSGQWSNATIDSDSGVTDASGQVSLNSDSVKNPSGTTFTFTVDGVAKVGWDYDSEANVETSKSINV
ncbi:MAG: S8 family serine peptidase [Euryarchaeota archaeon]|nr:S8 family serine peptidase [Euryarchaeota archaeon]